MREILRNNQVENMVYLSFPEWDRRHIGHGFSTRKGGLSTGSFDSLNLGYKGGDDPSIVAYNRSLFLGKIWGMQERHLFQGKQVHGTDVFIVDQKVIQSGIQTIPSTDALVTAESKVLLGAFSADCLLALFIDQTGPVIGTAHAGWKGTIKGILSNVVSVMEKNFNSRPENIQCLLGPCIKPCCYEIGEDVQQFSVISPWANQVVFQQGIRQGKRHLDLTGTNRNILIESGVKADHILTSDYCTCCNQELFYSYRRARGGPTGSLMGIIFLA